jgi:hypothetical protein
MGQSAAQAPTISPAQTGEMVNIYNQNIGATTRATDRANIASVGRQALAGLNMLTDQGASMNAEELTKLRNQEKTEAKRIKTLEARIAKTKNPKTLATLQSRLDALTTAQNERVTKINTLSSPDFAANKLRESFSEQYGMRDDLIGDMRGAVDPTSEYGRMQDAFGRGISAQTANTAQASAAGIGQVADVRGERAGISQGQAAQMGQVADVNARDVAASRMGDFGRATSRDITAGQVGAGALGQTLMGRAVQMAQSDGRLSSQAGRDAVQSARQGMAARGMATGNAALGAELLNRDRYARQRQFQDLGFAQGVQGQDLGRQFQNVGNQLAADQSNQGAAMQAEVANLQARYNAAVQQGNWEQAAAIQNQSANLQAQMSNQQTAFNTGQFNAANQQSMNLANMQALNQGGQFNAANQQQANLANQQTQFGREQVISGNTQQANLANMQASNNMAQFNAGQNDSANRFNMGLLEQSAVRSDQERLRQLGLQQDTYNFALGTDPRMVAAGLGNPYASLTGSTSAASNVLGSIAMNPQYSGGQFSSGGGLGQTLGMAGGALVGGAAGFFLGGGVGAVPGAALGAGLGGAAGSSLSDKREKTDIKLLGKVTSLLDLPAYEYRYKGEKKKRKGVMAQDVQKVLPEAVTEVDYQGKRRLAIKPGVIGAALAEELTNQTKAVAA